MMMTRSGREPSRAALVCRLFVFSIGHVYQDVVARCSGSRPPSPHPNVLHAFVDQDEPGHNLSALINGRDSCISLLEVQRTHGLRTLSPCPAASIRAQRTQRNIKTRSQQDISSPRQAEKSCAPTLRFPDKPSLSEAPLVSFSLSLSMLVPQPRPHHLLVRSAPLSTTRPLIWA